jgi:pimeloyl-ACP methyl ester carboxylesterase
MPFVQVGDTDIHYVTKGSGPPLVLIHGFGGCAQGWYQQIEDLAADFEVFAYDSVNHGHSSASPEGEREPDRVDELEGFLAALGIERPILAGNSMGALTLLRWATRHPGDAAALVPSGMGITPPTGDPDASAARSRAILAPTADDVLFLPAEMAFTEDFVARNRVQYERYVRIRSTATRLEASRRPRTPTASNPTMQELGGRVASITSPMHIVVGDRDWLFDAAKHLHELVPSSEITVIPGAPHNAYFEVPAQYNRALREFVGRVLS